MYLSERIRIFIAVKKTQTRAAMGRSRNENALTMQSFPQGSKIIGSLPASPKFRGATL